jgi:hypothetical protein
MSLPADSPSLRSSSPDDRNRPTRSPQNEVIHKLRVWSEFGGNSRSSHSPVTFLFVQQSKTENGPAPRISLLASVQGLTAISGGGDIHFSATFHATRPLDRGTLWSETDPRICDSRLRGNDMVTIYDLKSKGRDMRTQVKPKPESSQPAWRTCLGFLLRTFPVSAVSIRVKQSQFAALPRGTRLAVQTNPICTGAIWRASPLWTKSYGESDMQRTSAKQSQFRAGHGRAIVPNKANSPGGAGRDAAWRTRNGVVVQTNPIRSAQPRGGGVAVNKRSQSGSQSCRTKTISAVGTVESPIIAPFQSPGVGRGRNVQNEADFRPAGRHELHVTLGDSLHRARGMAQTIADVSARIGAQPGRADARTELSVSA